MEQAKGNMVADYAVAAQTFLVKQCNTNPGNEKKIFHERPKKSALGKE